MNFAILGPLVVRSGGTAVVLAAAKPRALLVRLLIDAHRTVPAELLIEDLWDGCPPRAAPQTLKTYVSQLRKALGSERVITTAGGYQIVVGEDELDAARFERAVTEARAALATGDAALATALLRDALTSWRGAPAGCPPGSGWGAC